MGQDYFVIDEDIFFKILLFCFLVLVVEYIFFGWVKCIVVMMGVGIFIVVGIFDFCFFDMGFYVNFVLFDLFELEVVFDLGFFKVNFRLFYVLVKELYLGNYYLMVLYVFVRLFVEKGLLYQLFIQNIDCLEREVGILVEKIIEVYGSFVSQRCIECKIEFDVGKMREFVLQGEVLRCEDGGCKGLVKLDIVFFGEQFLKVFFDRRDMVEEVDLVLVMGISLQVYFFVGLVDLVVERVLRVLFNLERVGSMGCQVDDVLVLGDCDEGVRRLVDEFGWREELEEKWRGLVGEGEVERQLQGVKKWVEVLYDEVVKLVEEVDEVLYLGEKKEKEKEGSYVEVLNFENKLDGEGKVVNEVDFVVEDVVVIKSLVKNIDIMKMVEVLVEMMNVLKLVDMLDGEGRIVSEQKVGGQ